MSKMSKKEDTHTEKEKYKYLQMVVNRINKSGHVSVTGSGQENLPEKNGYILFPNHQGFYDMLALIPTCPDMFGAVIKKEAADIILIKQVLGLIHGIAIDRKNMKSSYEVIMKMTQEAKDGYNFLIFAEGTLSHNGNNMLPMKGGSFKSAVNAKAPIVPVALIDAYKPFNEKGIKPVEVKVHYLKPLYYEEYRELRTNEIAQIVHDRIQEYINNILTT